MEKATRVWSLTVLVACCSMIGCQPSAQIVEVSFHVDRIELRPAEGEAGEGLEEAVDRSTDKKVFLHPPAKGLQGAEDIAKATIRDQDFPRRILAPGPAHGTHGGRPSKDGTDQQKARREAAGGLDRR